MTRHLKKFLHNLTCGFSIFLITVPPVMAQTVVSDENGPIIIESANGTPMVMINTPDANGVSHNTYVEFGVGPDGLILNNVGENTAPTDLGGIVQGNSNLAGGTASVIINEVTSTNPTVMNGFLEVGGDRADVIVANPYGITCDGCGFINTNRATVTTGSVTFDGDTFTGFSVDGGAINIVGDGLDATDSTRFDLISRQITVAGAVHGQRIRVIAGRNDVIYATGEITEKADDGADKPALAIDSTVVGGMYAGAITITSTEDGVGVRAPQNMAANAGQMMITADGRLVMGNATASENITVSSTADVVVDAGSNVVAGGDLDVSSANDLVLEANAKLVSDSAIDLTVGNDFTAGTAAEVASAAALDLSVTGAVHVADAAELIARGNATVTAASYDGAGILASSSGALNLTADEITNAGLLFGNTDLRLRSDGVITNNGGEIVSNAGLSIGGATTARAGRFTNENGGRVETIGGDITIAATVFENLREAPVITGDFELGDADLANPDCTGNACIEAVIQAGAVSQGGEAAQIVSAGNITLTGDTLLNQYSLISAQGNITIAADELVNIGANIMQPSAADPATLEFVGALFGTIEAGGVITGDVTGFTSNGALADDIVIKPGAGIDTGDTVSDAIGDSSLLVVNTDPTAEYLVETRDEFVDLDKFISSDYFLEVIQYDPELKRFGDAYAEALYIRKQLLALLGQIILQAGMDERAQIQAMYDNAIDAHQNLDLTPGVALTPDQIGALTSDIIWMEKTEINGEIVLAPRVYLANPEIRLAGLSGAMITARDVTFRGGDFNNNGMIRASGDMAIVSTGTFASSGAVSARDIMISAETIRIETGARQIVTLRDGKPGLLTASLRRFRGLEAKPPALDRVDRAARPSSLEAAGTLVLRASKDISTRGAQISAGTGAALIAGGDITIGALALSRATGDEHGKNFHRIESLTHLTSTMTSGGDLTLLSSGDAAGQNDITLEGATLQADGAIGLIARDGDVVIGAVADEYYSHRRRTRTSTFGFKKKVREDLVFDLTHQVSSLTGNEIVGVAARNMQIEGAQFSVVGVPGSDDTPGELALISVNGSTAFTAPVDLRATSHYRSSSTLWGLVKNTTDMRSLASAARGATAETAGDMLLNSGADLTLTAVDFQVDGQFNTEVAGATYLLAAIDMDYNALITHRDNGVIMTDIRSEEWEERVTYNGIVAAGGVNFDLDSPIIFAGIRSPMLDSAHPGAWVAQNDDGRMNLASAYLDPQEDTNEESGAETTHWRDDTSWAEDDGTLERILAPLPTAEDGAQYSYIAGLTARDSTVVEPIELVNYHFYEKKQALNPAFKALLTIAVTQGLGSLAALDVAGQLSQLGNAAFGTVNAAGATTLTTLGSAVNAATQSFAATLVVETTAGVVSGELDLNQIVSQASFSALSAGLTSGVNASTFGSDIANAEWAKKSLFSYAGFGTKFNVAELVEAGIDATLTAGLTVAMDDDLKGSEFWNQFASSMQSTAISLTMADLQDGVGDMSLGEGSLAHATLHGVVGCVAAEALDGNCASGAAAAVAMSIYAGTLDGTAPDESDVAAYNAWRQEVSEQAKLIGGAVGYLTSGGHAANVSNGGSIAQSGVVNNYLGHTELRQYRDELAACALNDDACFNAVAEKYEALSLALDAEFAACETDQCRLYHLSRIEAAEQSGAFDDIINMLNLNAARAGEAYGIKLASLQYDRAAGLNPTLYANLDAVGRAQLRGEVVAQMCGGTNIDGCSIATRYELLDWGALNPQEVQLLAFDVEVSRIEAHQRIRENMKFDHCGTLRGAACDAIVDAEIQRLEARAARIGGVLMIVGGGLEIATGAVAATTCETGIGCVFAAGLATHGADIAGHGAVQLWNGEITATFGGSLLQQAGLDPSQAELVYGFLGAGIEVAALRAMMKTPAMITPNALATYQRTGALPEGAATNKGDLPDTVYRGDGRGPEDIFDPGFQPKDPNADVDLETYVQTTPSPDSQYVSTTSDPEVATDFATQYGTQPGYVYDIDTPPNGVDVDATLGSAAIFDEAEIVIPDGVGVSGCRIRGCQPVNPDGTPSGPYIPNPNYTGGR